MSNYWNNKWAKAKDNWEEKQAKSDSSAEILAGLKRSPGGLGRARPKKTRDVLDVGLNNGRSVTLESGVAGGRFTTPLVELKGDDEAAKAITVSLQYNQLDEPANLINDVFAELEWGSAGFQANTVIDILRGTIINLNCSWLRIKAGLDADDGAIIKFGAFACYGNRPAVAPVQRTEILTGLSVPGSISAPVVIPAFAQNVTFSTVTLAGTTGRGPAAYQIEFLDNTGITVGAAYFVPAASGPPNAGHQQSIPVVWPNSAVAARVRNNEPVGEKLMSSSRLIFGLSL